MKNSVHSFTVDEVLITKSISIEEFWAMTRIFLLHEYGHLVKTQTMVMVITRAGGLFSISVGKTAHQQTKKRLVSATMPPLKQDPHSPIIKRSRVNKWDMVSTAK